MTPGVDYYEFEELGWDRPSPSAYTTYCKRCWRDKGPTAEEEEEADTASDPEVLAEENDHEGAQQTER